MKVREESLKYGASKKREISRQEEEIGRSIAKLEKCLGEKYVGKHQKQKVWSDLETKKRELEVTIEHRTKGAIVRSKSQWYNEGEKNNNYFLNLEKRHCKQGTITQLKVNTDRDDRICSDKEILNECESFYQNLYSSKVVTDNAETDCFFTQQPNEKCLNKNEKLFCEGLLNRKECLDALKSMKSVKSPGTDGLPSKFYKVFGMIWKKY